MFRLNRFLVLVVVLAASVFLSGSSAAAQEIKRDPVPTDAAVAKAKALIDELFSDDLKRSEKEPPLKAALALRFLEEGRDTRDYPAGRYALWTMARDLAGAAGDAPTALAAVEELSQAFVYPPGAALSMRIEALLQASHGFTTPAGYQITLDRALVLLEDAVANDNYPACHKLIEAAESAARKLRSIPLVTAVRKRQEEVAQLEKEFARWKPYADKLAKNADDADASFHMGRYYALVRGDWDRGLTLLAKGKNAIYKAVAVKDLAEPRSGGEQYELAKNWMLATNDVEPALQIQGLLRAYYWLQQSLGDLDGRQRLDAEKTLDGIIKRLPLEYQIGEITGEVGKCVGHSGPAYAAAFLPDGRKAISAGADGSLHLWDVRTGKSYRGLDGHSGRVWTVAVAPDGRRALSGGFDSSIRLWDLLTGREISRLPGHGDYVRSVVFSRDGHFALSGGDDRLVRLWNLDTGKEVRSFPGHDHFVWSVALSRDGKTAVSGSLDKTVKVWDVASGSALHTLKGHKDTVMSVAISPDGRRALSAGTDGMLILWDLTAGKAIHFMMGHKGYVHSAAFSPDGRRALSAGQDRTIRLWDLQKGKEELVTHKSIRVLDGHTDQIWSIGFSRDGRLAISAAQDGTLRIWGGVK